MKTTSFWKTGSTTDASFGTHHHTESGRRKHSRGLTKLPVQFELPGVPVISAFAQNLSLKGMQVCCSHTRIKTFVDDAKSLDDIPVLVVMRLRVGNRLSSQVLRCRLCYMKELQAGEMILGLEFNALLAEQREALQSVMQQSQDATRSQDIAI